MEEVLDIKEMLDREAARINNPEFIDADPVQFPRRFSDVRDIEIVSLLCSTIAWGNRKMICRDCEKMLALMDYQPYNYVADEGYEDLPEGNIHRTFFNRNLRHYLRGLHRIYARHGSLQDFARAEGIAASEARRGCWWPPSTASWPMPTEGCATAAALRKISTPRRSNA